MAGNHGNTTDLVRHQRCNGYTKRDEVRHWWSQEERRGGAAAGGEKGGLNKSPSPSAPADSVQVQVHCVAIGGNYLCGWPWNDWFLSGARSCSSKPSSGFVCVLKSGSNSDESELIARLHRSAETSLMNLPQKIMYFYIYSLLIKAFRDKKKKFLWLHHFLDLHPVPPMSSSLSSPLSLHSKSVLSLPGSADCDAWLSVFSKSPLVPGSRPPPLAQTAIKTRSVAAQPAAWKWEDGEERGRDGGSQPAGRENTLVLVGSQAEKRSRAWDEGKGGMARKKTWKKGEQSRRRRVGKKYTGGKRAFH